MNRYWLAMFVVFLLINPARGLLKEPCSVAVGKGRVYIVGSEKRIDEYDLGGKYIRGLNDRMWDISWTRLREQMALTGQNTVTGEYAALCAYLRTTEVNSILRKAFYPDYICCDRSGAIYGVGFGLEAWSLGGHGSAGIIDPGDGHTVLAFGEYTEEDKPYGLREPRGIAADSQGNMYVGYRGPYCIKKFDRAGRFVCQWGRQGGGDGECENPLSIAIDRRNGDIYVVDSYQYWDRSPQMRIQKFTKDGRFIKKWGEHLGFDWRPLGWFPLFFPSLTNIPDLDTPAGISVDSQGFVYVAENRKNRITKFDGDGKVVLSFGERGSGPGQFEMSRTSNLPVGIAIDEGDNVYVCDEGNDRVQKFDQNGKFLMEFK